MDSALVDAFVRRLGFEGRPQPTLAGLSALYLAWCRSVPFDNLRKRQWLASGATDPPPGAEADDFFTAYLEHGTGGTCWAVSGAMTDLLLELGFDARRVASSMLPFPDVPNRPNHGTTIVRFGEEQWMVDTSMLTEAPLPLDPARETTGGEGILSARVEPLDSLWRVWWKPWRAGPDEMPCELERDDVDRDLYLARYRASVEMSPFNAATYVRKGHAGGVRTLTGSTLVEVDRGGVVQQTDVADRRDDVLVGVFGYSPEIVAGLPPDETGPRPQVPSSR